MAHCTAAKCRAIPAFIAPLMCRVLLVKSIMTGEEIITSAERNGCVRDGTAMREDAALISGLT